MSKKSKARKRRMRFASNDPNVIMHIDSIEATLLHKPYYNGYICRGGIHGDTSYNRRKFKADTRRILHEDW